jgi:hypothetical protein
MAPNKVMRSRDVVVQTKQTHPGRKNNAWIAKKPRHNMIEEGVLSLSSMASSEQDTCSSENSFSHGSK